MQASRRQFLAASAGLAAGAMVSSTARAQDANGAIRLGFIGCGGRGNSHIDDCIANKAAYNVEIVALCDVWKQNLDATVAKVKDAGAEVKTFSRYADLLALADVDAVVIATPDFAHSPILVDAAKAKKHAYVEKPMAVRLEDAIAAVDAVEEHGIVCQVGTQYRSDGQYIAAAEQIQAGILGTMVKADIYWNDNRPRWLRDFHSIAEADVDWEQYLMYLPKEDFDPRRFRCWHLYRDFTIGLSGLLGSHRVDIASWFTGETIPQYSTGMGAIRVWKEREHYDTQDCLYMYPSGFMLQWSCHLANNFDPERNAFHGTRGSIDTITWTLDPKGASEPGLDAARVIEPVPSVSHMQNWIDCIRTDNKKTNATVHDGFAHSVASIMGARACDTGRRQVYKPETRSIEEG